MIKFLTFFEMVLKTTLWDQKTFSLLFWKILGLNFLFRKYFSMSHIDDVIKIHFKSSLQKTKKHSYWNLVRFEPSLRFEIIYFHDFTSSYWLLFYRTRFISKKSKKYYAYGILNADFYGFYFITFGHVSGVNILCRPVDHRWFIQLYP